MSMPSEMADVPSRGGQACGCRERGVYLCKDLLNQPVLFSSVLCNLSMAGNGNASETKESKLK